MTDKFVSTIYEGPDGEVYIDLPDELIEKTGWDTLTDLVWVVEEDKITLRKKENNDSSYEA